MLAIYSRISVDRENQKSIIQQKELGEDFAKKYGYTFRHYSDKGISGGGKISNRPEFNQMVEDIENGIIDAIYIWNQDRTSREELVWFQLATIIIEYKVKLFENGQLVDLEDPTVYTMRGMKSIFDANYRRQTSRNIKGVVNRNAREGKSHGILPYGFKKAENGDLVPDDEESEIVRKIYELSLKGYGQVRICNYLNERNVPTRKTKLGHKNIIWTSGTIFLMLKNPLYKGKRLWKDKVYDVEPIIEPTLWERVQKNRETMKTRSGTPTEHKYLLAYKIRCKKCGKNYLMKSHKKNRDYSYYMCSGKKDKRIECANSPIKQQPIENFIWQRFFKDRELYKLVEKHFTDNSNKEKIEELENELNLLARKKDRLGEDMKRAVRLAVEGKFEDHLIEPEKQRISNELDDAQIREKALLEQLGNYREAEKKLKEVGLDFTDLKENTPYNDKRNLIEKYIDFLTVDYEGTLGKGKKGWYSIEIHFNIPNMEVESYRLNAACDIAIHEKADYKSINLTGQEHFEDEVKGLVYFYDKELNSYDAYPNARIMDSMIDYDQLMAELEYHENKPES